MKFSRFALVILASTLFTANHGTVLAAPTTGVAAGASQRLAGGSGTAADGGPGDESYQRVFQRLTREERLDPAQVRRAYNAEKTKDSYRGVIAHFCIWLYDEHDDGVSDEVLSHALKEEFNSVLRDCPDNMTASKRNDKLRTSAVSWIKNDEDNNNSNSRRPMVDFNLFTPDLVNTYLCTRTVVRKVSGVRKESLLGVSRYGAIRTALTSHLMDTYKVSWTDEQKNDMKRMMAGIKRLCSEQTQLGNGKMEPGKREMSFALYESINLWLMQRGTRDAAFARSYLVNTWNLVCRSDSTQHVKTSDLVWREDANGIVFAHQKNDQQGSRKRKARHIYANPFNILVCPFLALFEYLAVYPEILREAGNRRSKLYRGGSDKRESASARFWSILKDVLEEHEEEVHRLGYEIDDLGTHSIRKGASTYISSGTTAAPSAVAINIRGGWSMGIHETYMLWEKAGDNYCGRVAAGLPVLSPKFACCPPDFIVPKKDGVSENVRQTLQAEVDRAVDELLHDTFGVIPTFLYKTCRHGLACALYGMDDSRRNFPPGAAIESTHYFRSTAATDLRKHAIVMMPWDGDDSYFQKVTGIPPHIVQLSKTEELNQNIKKVIPAIERIMQTQLDERAYGGTISEGRVRSIVEGALVETLRPIHEGINRLEAGQGATIRASPEAQQQDNDPAMARYGGMKFHNGKSRRVPETFRFPDSHGSNLYQQWFIGSEPLHTPPLRMIQHDDVDFIVRGVRTLNDIRYFVRIVNDEAKRRGIYVDQPSPAECLQVYGACSSVFKIPTKTDKGRDRNMASLKWSSMVRLHSETLKRRRNEERSGDAADSMLPRVRRVRRRPDTATVLQRRQARGLVDGNTRRRRSNDGVRGGRESRRPRGSAAAAGGDFAAAFGTVVVPPGALAVNPQEVARIRQQELAEIARQTQQAAVRADADGNLLHVGRGAAGAPSARDPNFLGALDANTPM